MEERSRERRIKWPRAICLGAFLSISACDSESPVLPCLLYAEIGILATVMDSISGGAVSADSVVGTVTDGLYVERVRTTPAQALTGFYFAEERAGVYQVAIAAEGYEPWIADGVSVTRDECHVRRVTLSARLRPA